MDLDSLSSEGGGSSLSDADYFNSLSKKELSLLHGSPHHESTPCFSCSTTFHITFLSRHPLLGVPICNPCKQFYSSQPWKPDNKSFDRCRSCARDKHPLTLCREKGCKNAFCSRCLEKNVAGFAISNKASWSCLTCDTSQIVVSRAKYFSIFNYWREKHDLKLYSDPVTRYLSSSKDAQAEYNNSLFWEYEMWKKRLQSEPNLSDLQLKDTGHTLLKLYKKVTRKYAKIMDKLKHDLELDSSSQSEDEREDKSSVRPTKEPERKGRSVSPCGRSIKNAESKRRDRKSSSSQSEESVSQIRRPLKNAERERRDRKSSSQSKEIPSPKENKSIVSEPRDQRASSQNEEIPCSSRLQKKKKKRKSSSPSIVAEVRKNDLSPKPSPRKEELNESCTADPMQEDVDNEVSILQSDDGGVQKTEKKAASSIVEIRDEKEEMVTECTLKPNIHTDALRNGKHSSGRANALYESEAKIVLKPLDARYSRQLKTQGFVNAGELKTDKKKKKSSNGGGDDAVIARLCNFKSLTPDKSSSTSTKLMGKLSPEKDDKEVVTLDDSVQLNDDDDDVHLEDESEDEMGIKQMSSSSLQGKKLCLDSSSDGHLSSIDSSGDEEGKKEKSKEHRTRRQINSEDSSEEKSSSSKAKLPDFMTIRLNDKERHSSGSSTIKSVSVEKVVRKKRKRIVLASDSSGKEDRSESESSSSSDSSEKRKKRRRRKKDSDDDDDCNESPSKGRKNIHKILKSSKLSDMTKEAAEIERERRKRIEERLELYQKEFASNTQSSEKLDELVLDFNKDTKEVIVEVDRALVGVLKPHQANGVRFMWDSVFESRDDVLQDKTPGGAILAHCMGLGKTLQTITLIHTVLTNFPEHITRVLIISPVNTVKNWKNEFEKWCEDSLSLDVYELSEEKGNSSRADLLGHWHRSGGVLIIGYGMYRILTQFRGKKLNSKQKNMFTKALVNPGPELVICDEGHVLKNRKSALNVALNLIKTRRRIILTGTPLQNNLSEYFAMVDFVKPSLLGTYVEFKNRFVNPIQNGQHSDSTDRDVRIMKKRSFILSDLLKGCLQRLDYNVLVPFLQPKHEYVLCINLTELQKKLYMYYLDNFAKAGVIGGEGKMEGGKKGGLFNDVSTLSQIWNHPIVLSMSKERSDNKKMLEDDGEELSNFIDDEKESDTSSSDSGSGSAEDSDIEVLTENVGKVTRSLKNEAILSEGLGDSSSGGQGWWSKHLESEEDLEHIRHSSKIIILLEILRNAEVLGDKTLVFSQSILSLDMIEAFLRQLNDYHGQGDPEKIPESLRPFVGSWVEGRNYYRMDGSTNPATRQKWCDYFNRPANIDMKLFLISTKAGGLGINLVSANRVIIFDASWNPAHDLQSVFRVYRFGQIKPVYIYRFLAKGTMEEKIYDRQVTKQSLSARVVDEQQIERHFSLNELSELYEYKDEDQSERPVPKVPVDDILAEILAKYPDKIWKFHDHDSLLENQVDENLTEEERKSAWEEYENEKKGIVSTLVPSSGGAQQQQALQQQLFTQNINFLQIQRAYRIQNPTLSNEEILRATRQYFFQLQKAQEASQAHSVMVARAQNNEGRLQAAGAQPRTITEVQLDGD